MSDQPCPNNIIIFKVSNVQNGQTFVKHSLSKHKSSGKWFRNHLNLSSILTKILGKISGISRLNTFYSVVLQIVIFSGPEINTRINYKSSRCCNVNNNWSQRKHAFIQAHSSAKQALISPVYQINYDYDSIMVEEISNVRVRSEEAILFIV